MVASLAGAELQRPVDLDLVVSALQQQIPAAAAALALAVVAADFSATRRRRVVASARTPALVDSVVLEREMLRRRPRGMLERPILTKFPLVKVQAARRSTPCRKKIPQPM